MPGRRTVLATAAAALALLFVHAAISGCDHDEVQHLHGAFLVSQGNLPFRDFLEQRHPVVYYALAPATRLFDGSPHALVFAVRSLDVVLFAAALLVFLRVCRPYVRDPRAVWPLLVPLGCFWLARNSMEVRPDPWMALLCLVALWQWAAYLREGGLRRAAIAGLCVGLAVAVLQKAVAFAGLLALGTLPVALGGRERLVRALRGAAVAVGAAVVPLALLALALWRAGLWQDFVFWNYPFNRFYYLATRFDGPSAAAVLGVSVAEDPLLWIGGLVGLWVAVRQLRSLADQPELALAAAVVIGILASVAVSRWPFSHNLLLMQPALALLAVVAIEELRVPRWRTAASVLLVALVAKVGVLCFTYDEGHGNFRVQERILAMTARTEAVAAPPPYHPIFRRDSFFFWYVPVNNAQAYAELCRLRPCPPGKLEHDLAAWREDPPAVVYLPPDEPSWAPVGFEAHRAEYAETDVPGLWRRTARTAPRAERR